MFVTFIPSKQFEEGWWTQPCVDKIYLGTTDVTGIVNNLSTGDSQSTEKASSSRDENGIDAARALEVCQLQLDSKGTDPLPRHKHDNMVLEIPESKSAPHGKNVDLFRNAYKRAYKKWSGNSLSIFSELSNVVVSGTHIIEDSQLQPIIVALNCTTDTSGNLVFPTPEKDTLTCGLTGKNLDKIAKLRLRNAKDATDTTSAEGRVAVSGDSTNALVTFITSALHFLPQPAYDVFAVSSKGVEQKTQLAIHLPTDPHVSKITPDPIDFSTDASTQKLTIAGDHLKAVDTVVLTNSDSSQKATIFLKLDALKSDTQLLVQIDPKTMSDFKDAKTTVNVALMVGSKNVPTGQHFEYFGTPKSPTPPKKPNPPKAATPKANAPNGATKKPTGEGVPH